MQQVVLDYILPVEDSKEALPDQNYYYFFFIICLFVIAIVFILF